MPEKDTEKVIDWKHEKTGRIRKYQHGDEIEHAKANLPLLISHTAAKRAIADGYKKAKDKGGIDGQGKEREQTVQQKKCFVYNDTHNILPKACLISECFLYRSISAAGKQCDICHCRC